MQGNTLKMYITNFKLQVLVLLKQ